MINNMYINHYYYVMLKSYCLGVYFLAKSVKLLMSTVPLGVIQQLRGTNLTQFRPPSPSSGQLWTFEILPTI